VSAAADTPPVGVPRRRAAELRLLIFAVLIAVFAYVALSYGHDGRVDATAVTYGVSLLVLYGAAHLAVRFLAPNADPVLLPLAALLNGVGLVVVRRGDLFLKDKGAPGAKHPAAPLQLVWTVVGIVVFIAVLALVRDHRVLDRYRYTLALIGLGLLLIPAVPGLGTTINGAKLWVNIGGVSFQPSEIAKICLIIFFASYLVSKREVLSLATRRVAGLHLPRARDLGPVLLAWLASMAVLVREKDLGSSLLFFGIFIVMLYVVTQRTSWLLIGLGLFGAGTMLAYQLFSHVRSRITTQLHPLAGGKASQLGQGLFGFANGGLVGSGLGRGAPQVFPYQYIRTDFVAALIGEELGLVGMTALLAVFALLVLRGLRTAIGCRDDFGKLLATGLSFALALQVFVVIGGVTRLIPLTGMTLPFVAYGGSSIVANYALVALLIRISDSGRAQTATAAPAPAAQDQTGEMTQVIQRGRR
jgi:cell division protein FtsW (lipid II flippase)